MLRGNWRWILRDWLASPGGGDLPATAREITADWPRQTRRCRVLVGHSAGGVIAMQVAVALGTELDGLILINTGASTAHHGDPDLPRRLLRQWGETFIETFLRRCISRKALNRHGDELRRYALATGPQRAYRAMRSLRQLDLTPRLDHIQCPTLVIHGEYDMARSTQHARELAAGIAGARLVILQASHTPMLDCPETFSSIVDDFLAMLL